LMVPQKEVLRVITRVENKKGAGMKASATEATR
jgi:hypothetical protein